MTEASATGSVSGSVSGSASRGARIDFASGVPVAGSWDVRWDHGVARRDRKRDTSPPIQVHAFDEHTVILRQSKAVNYEAPFMFLLFGNERALLLDTGAVGDAEVTRLRATVDGLIEAWLAGHPRDGYGLVVAHTHGHGDHVAGDVQFEGRPDTTVVAKDVAAVREFYGFGDGWPEETVEFDLGGRVLEVFGSPGHQEAAVTFYDPWTGILFTGDSVLPGRLYAKDFPGFVRTVQRMVEFAERRPVTHVLGCHVEMKRGGRDFPLGATYQPGEAEPQMSVAQLVAVRDAVVAAADRPGVHRYGDFVIYHGMGRASVARLLVRGWVNKIWPGR